MLLCDQTLQGVMLGTWHPTDCSCDLLSLQAAAGTTTHASGLRSCYYCTTGHNKVRLYMLCWQLDGGHLRQGTGVS